MPILVTQAEYAAMCGVEPWRIASAVNYAIPDAIDGSSVDILHPIAVAFMQAGAPTATKWRELVRARGGRARLDHPDGMDVDWKPSEVPDDISIVLDKTLRYILTKFGSVEQFNTWLKTVKDAELIKEKQIKNAVSCGELIHREYVRVHMFGAIAETITRLLTDSPRTIASRSKELVESGADLEDVETLVEEIMSGHITTMRDKLKKAMEHAK